MERSIRIANSINWFEIPAADDERACGFYGALFGTSLHREEVMGTKMGFLPTSDGGVGGAVVAGRDAKPSTEGTLVYLNGGGDLAAALARAQKAGATVLVPRTKISDETGYFAVILDSEGNRVALHSPR